MPTNRNAAGVTLVELIFTLAVLAVLMSLSAPALAGLIQASQARSARGMLATSLALARMSAIARNAQISVCPSSDQASCTGGIAWQTGWIVFVDTNRDGKHDAGEQILEVAGAQAGTAIATTAGRSFAAFRGDGSAAGLNLTFTLCDRRGPDKATTFVINNGGRVRAGLPTAAQSAGVCAAFR